MTNLSRCTRNPVVRLVTHLIAFIGYLCVGAALFQIIEGPEEKALTTATREARAKFADITHDCITEEELEKFIETVVHAANRGVSAVRNVTLSEPNWSFGQALFFATTVLTTIGYGRVTPLSDAGKAFCIVYAIIGIPLTLVLFSALVERLLIPLKALLYFLFRKFGSLHKTFHIQLFHLGLVVTTLVVFFMLIPAGIFSALEPGWNYLDGFYYCFISLTTIGLGDYIPGDNANQPHRALYKVATTVYLILGLLMMMIMLSTVYEIPELNLGFHFYLKNDNPDDENKRLHGDPEDASASGAAGFKYRKQADDPEAKVTAAGSSGTYQSFQDKELDGEGGEE